MKDITQQLMQLAADSGVPLTQSQAAQFQQYLQLLLSWNEKLNLTAITDPDAVVNKHFLDSIYPARFLRLRCASCVDVGTGAGFPGLALKIAVPDMRLCLLDSLQKRLHVLQDISAALDLQADFLHARAEEAGHDSRHREQYAYAFARAVAPLPALCEYCLPLVQVGGLFCAWKGPEPEEELQAARGAIARLGGRLQWVERYTLPDGAGRTLIMIAKQAPCPQRFPRLAVKIKKTPLC